MKILFNFKLLMIIPYIMLNGYPQTYKDDSLAVRAILA